MEKEPKKFPEGYFEKKAEGYNISGKGIDSDRKVDLAAYLEGRKDESAKPMEGELEKTEEEIRFIGKINEYLDEQFKEMGIDKKVDIDPNSIHFLPVEVFKKKFPLQQAPAFYDGFNQRTCLNKPYFDHKSIFYYAILHEAIHRASYQGFHKDTKEENEEETGEGFINRKSGYRTSNHEKGHFHLNVLNEMVTEKIFREIIKKHAREIAIEFDFSGKPGVIEEVYSEHYDLVILNEIIRGISEKKQEKEEDIWARFKKGYFTGEIMHLRDIERTFGKDALKVLGSLNINSKDEDLNIYKKDYSEVLGYFITEDEEGRKRIAEEILSKKHAEERP